MANSEQLRIVKLALGITGDYQNDTLSIYIDEVLDWMKSSGVPDSVLATSSINGALVRGVSDLWNYGQGDAELSPYFHQRVIQLCREVSNVPTEGS